MGPLEGVLSLRSHQGPQEESPVHSCLDDFEERVRVLGWRQGFGNHRDLGGG